MFEWIVGYNILRLNQPCLSFTTLKMKKLISKLRLLLTVVSSLPSYLHGISLYQLLRQLLILTFLILILRIVYSLFFLCLFDPLFNNLLVYQAMQATDSYPKQILSLKAWWLFKLFSSELTTNTLWSLLMHCSPLILTINIHHGFWPSSLLSLTLSDGVFV